jgi:hypothetical protein
MTRFAERDVDDNFNINPKHRQIAALGRKMIDMSSKMTGTDDSELMMANALSRLGEALESFGASFGPKSLADVAKKTGMSEDIIKMLIQRAKADTGASDNQAAEMSEGLGDMAHMAEQDHEVQMARAELYKIAKYAIKLHDMLKGVSEAEGIEGWMQSKITKAADYMGSVYHTMEYDTVSESKKFKSTLTQEQATEYKSQLSAKLEGYE